MRDIVSRARSKQEQMNALTAEIRDRGGLADFARAHRLVVAYHDTLPLAILHYGRAYRRYKASASVLNQCRGMVLELGSLRVVAKPFDRCADKRPSRESRVVDVQTKEDGTLVVLWHYAGEWRVSCRHNFADDVVSHPPGPTPTTYAQLFWSLVPPRAPALLDKACCYMLEMCSAANRVVHLYDPPALFLLGASHPADPIGTPLGARALDDLAARCGFSRPRVHEELCTKQGDRDGDALCRIQEHLSDVKSMGTREGFLVTLSDGTRFKAKNPLYRRLHTLKYRNWAGASPRVLKGLADPSTGHIPDGLLRTLRELGSDTAEVQTLAWLYAAHRRWDGDETAVHPSIDERYHASAYCWPPLPPPPRDYPADLAPVPAVGDLGVRCAQCRGPMALVRLKQDHVAPSLCHCGRRVGCYVLATGLLAWVCPRDQSTHEAHQADDDDGERPGATTGPRWRRGQPLGIPCSPATKVYRLHVHALLAQLFPGDRTKGYQVLATLLHLTRDECHMARFDRAQCYRALERLVVWQGLAKAGVADLRNVALVCACL